MNRFVVDVARQIAIPTIVTDAANPSSATGTGPTVFGLFADMDSAEDAAAELGPEAIVCQGGVTAADEAGR